MTQLIQLPQFSFTFFPRTSLIPRRAFSCAECGTQDVSPASLSPEFASELSQRKGAGWSMIWVQVVAGIVLAALVVAAWRAVRCEAGWRAWVCYQIDRLHALLVTRLRMENACTIPEFGPAIIVANHTSPVDPPMLWIRHYAGFTKPRLRVIGFLMAREFMGRGLVAWVCRAMESIPVGRSGRDSGPMREALRRLEAGHLLGVFPEGRLNKDTPDEQLLPGGTGAAWLALHSGAPVIPIFIRNAPRHRSLVWAFLTRTRSSLRYGPPVDLSRWRNRKIDHDVLTEVTDEIMRSIAALGGIRYTPIANRSVSAAGVTTE